MKHSIVAVGAGYAGFPAVKRLARQVHPDEVDITLVNASEDFVERPRLHQLATGQRLRTISLAEHLAGTGVRLLVGTATTIDAMGRRVHVDTAAGQVAVHYDTLIYAAGSTIQRAAVPGAATFAHHLSDPASARRLLAHVRDLSPTPGRVVVCGGGLTGIEAAAELAEAFPALRVELVSSEPPGAWLSPRARRYLDRSFEHLGIAVRHGARVTAVGAEHVALSDGSAVPFDVCVWAGGFCVPTLARDSGLAVDAHGRALVDETLRSVSHPDIAVIGDAAAAAGPWGDALAMGCRTGGFTGPYVADAIATRLAGSQPPAFTFRYLHECISLGRRRGLVQLLHADQSPRRVVLTGRPAVAYKGAVLSSVVWLFRWPGPYLRRRRRRVAAPAHSEPVGV